MAQAKSDMKILVVDDFPTMRRIVKTLLRQNGYSSFVEAEDGDHALSVLKATPDVEFIISDWSMPKTTGLEFLKAVRADAKFKHIPFLMVGAEAEKESMAEATKWGVSSHVVKPFTGAALGEKITKIFQTPGIKKAG